MSERDYTIKPLRNLVFLQPVQKEEKDGSVIIPEEFRYHKKAVVIAVGPKVTDLKIGDVVFLGEATGGSVEVFRGEKFIIMREDNIPGNCEDE